MKIGFDFVQASIALAGGGWYSRSLLEAMADASPQHEFLCYRHFDGWCVPADQLAPLPTRPNIVDPFSGQDAATAGNIWRQALGTGHAPGQPDLVHSTSFQAPRLKSAKLVVTIFDLSFWAVPEYTTDGIRLACESGVLDALEHADGLIFISEHARQEFEHFLPRFRRRGQIPSIVTPLASRWAVNPAPAGTAGDYWLFVGSLEPRKNLDGLLDGYERYVADHPKPKPLWLAGGTGWKNKGLQARIARLEARGLARHHGVVSEARLQTLYRQAQALIFPSWYEGFGLPVLEAMAQGCPVICSDRTSLPEVGGDAPYYVNPAAPAEIAAALGELEQNAVLRAQHIQRGLAQAARFSWEQTAKQTLAFYQRILSARQTAA